MTIKMICTECPVGCALAVTVEKGKVIKVEGQKCPRGEKHAVDEMENPVRVLTSTVVTEGLSVKMLPVKTDRPIPKTRLFKAMEEVKKIRVSQPTRVGDVVVKNFLGLGVDLIATRSISRRSQIRS
jgi:CxxC motif-containing protein